MIGFAKTSKGATYAAMTITNAKILTVTFVIASRKVFTIALWERYLLSRIEPFSGGSLSHKPPQAGAVFSVELSRSLSHLSIQPTPVPVHFYVLNFCWFGLNLGNSTEKTTPARGGLWDSLVSCPYSQVCLQYNPSVCSHPGPM